ncbi:FtsK/SpoIIIE domain-containing protein [Arthrobacter roseus]|uniref:FtsK/SpoIIIE domain-containing protein n=1 Tax=Arthrobacter roseus TaxID=136274 RepID=UPI00196452F9|nr:FtsK/SpoIIIE domain-containing protein [Arthrobacter roseus]MBM7849098.1 S-DNA-T family DNA segregation ATPase FtsK/SpoIIIE [Arthrobacter roseus]
MTLHFTLVMLGSDANELVANTTSVNSGDALAASLAELYGPGSYTVGGKLLAGLVPGQWPLVNGCIVVRGDSRPRNRQPPSLVLAVNTGPDAGQVFPLLRGDYEIGRTGCPISINDPELSRKHAVLTVSDHHISLRDHGSVNGTWVDGSRIDHVKVDADSLIRLGSSRCSIVPASSWQRAPVGEDVNEPLIVDSPPPPEKNRMVWVTALLPLVLGVVLAVTTQMWFFLAFSGLSAVTGLVPLLSGRRKRRAFTAAVDSARLQDEKRRRRAAPDPAILHLAVQHGRLELSNSAAQLRLGLADQPANLQVKPAQQGWAPPVLADVPALVDISRPNRIVIKGSQDAASALVRSLVLQLSVYDVEMISYGHAEDIPAGLRFLPASTIVSDPADLLNALSRSLAPVVILWRHAAELSSALEASGKSIFWIHGEDIDASHVITTTFHGGSICNRQGHTTPFTPDLIGTRTFEAMARAIASVYLHDDNSGSGPVPDTVRFDSITPVTAAGIKVAWDSGKRGLRAPLGSAESVLEFDLASQGPHLLVAGTTGAGKSELLRALVLGIATQHSPSTVNFLYIDFKGGSGLGPLDSLPHSVGMLTDLSAENVARALVSLKAEVKRREHLFAHFKVSDIGDYALHRRVTDPLLPRLVIVVDEFRMLTEEVPTAVKDLMRIATLGRSLGVHLIMATQRPQGAITPDIRANITASIALRVQSAADSQDVLNSAVAASIPVALPGRAFIKVGNEAPIEFQAASTLGSADPTTVLKPVTDFAGFLHARSTAVGTDNTLTQLDAALAAISVAADGWQAPWRPIQPALPSAVPVPSTTVAIDPEKQTENMPIFAGILDIPDEQRQCTLEWDPETDSHLALVGISGSGNDDAMRGLVIGIVRCRPKTHVYILDGDSLMAGAAELRQVGAYIRGHEVKRAARTLKKLSAIISDRLADHSVNDALPAPVAVVVTGWGRWVSVLRSSRWAWAEDCLGDIVRDGEKAGVTVLINGDRDLLASRFFTLVTNRVFLPSGSSTEAQMMWPKRPEMDLVPGRAFVQGRISTPAGAVAQTCAVDSSDFTYRVSRLPTDSSIRPPRVEPLPRAVATDSLDPTVQNGQSARIPIGLGGDELETVRMTVSPRGVTAILGGPGTGKTNFLNLLRTNMPDQWTLLSPHDEQDPVRYWSTIDAQAIKDLSSTHGTLALVDDADRMPPEVHQKLGQLHQGGVSVVFTAMPSPTLISKIPLAMEARSSGTGIVLCARQSSDADFFGIRLELEGRLPSGRAHVIVSGEVEEAQLALAP